jgi:hypothetical protein
MPVSPPAKTRIARQVFLRSEKSRRVDSGNSRSEHIGAASASEPARNLPASKVQVKAKFATIFSQAFAD